MDRDPVGDLLNAAAGRLAAYGYLLTGSQSAGEALLEDAIVRVFARRRPPGGAAERLVREAMRGLHLTSVRRARHVPPTPQMEPHAPDHIGDALAHLAPQERAVVVLRHHDRLPIPQIAAAMRVSEAAVERSLAGALARLTAVLGPIDPVMDPVPVLARRAS